MTPSTCLPLLRARDLPSGRGTEIQIHSFVRTSFIGCPLYVKPRTWLWVSYGCTLGKDIRRTLRGFFWQQTSARTETEAAEPPSLLLSVPGVPLGEGLFSPGWSRRAKPSELWVKTDSSSDPEPGVKTGLLQSLFWG